MSNILPLNTFQLVQAFRKNIPIVYGLACSSGNSETFKKRLHEYISMHANKETDAAKHLLELIRYDGKTIHELSTESDIPVQTISILWNILHPENTASTGQEGFLADLYMQFCHLEHPSGEKPSNKKVEQWMARWASGIDKPVKEIRKENKERMIHLLIKKIEARHNPVSKYIFPEGATPDQKYGLVNTWWNSHKFQLAMAIKGPRELNAFLNNSLSESRMEMLYKAKKKGMPFFATPYYLSLLDPSGLGYNDETIRSYILYSDPLIDTFGHIKAWEREDVVEPGKPNMAGWLLPEGHNIHRRYPEVAILIPDSMGRACGGLCASCQRMYDFQSQRLNFEFETLKPKESWNQKLRRLMDYFESDTQLRDILITGGDALMSQNSTLANMLDAVYKMALRKRKANTARAAGEKYAEIQRVRLGSRLLAYLPMRVNDELIGILKDFKEKGQQAGIRQFIIQTHFQTPLEITPEAVDAINRILSAGWTITNQLVFTVAASRRGHTAQLRKMLNSIGVICYYTFTVKGFQENYAVFTPNSRSMQEQQEEKVLGTLSKAEQEEVLCLLEQPSSLAANLRTFLKTHHKPFVVTGRNVLNLPAIGKSMTFTTVGVTGDGKRILRFNHDQGRRHSPIIDRMGEVYIVENKSIREYLLQLEKLGENPGEYQSIWHYTRGITEPRFKAYEYPLSESGLTEEMSNLQLRDCQKAQ